MLYSRLSHAVLFVVLCVSVAVGVSGCKSLQTEVYQPDLLAENGEPAYITVQHCLISFAGVQGISATRSQEEAEALAHDLFEKAKAGENFDRIIKKYTDDSPPGIYRMANTGFQSDMSSIVPSKNVFARNGMVPAFGDVGFKLAVGEFGLSDFDPKTSPYGWHIIKRLK